MIKLSAYILINLNTFNLKSISKESYLYGICFSIFVLLKIDFDLHFELFDNSKLVFSQATSDGIEINKRVSLFYNSLILGLLLIVLGVFLFSSFEKRIKNKFINFPELNLFAITYVSLALLEIMQVKTRISLDILEIIFILRILLVLLIEKNQIFEKKIDFGKVVSYSFILLFFILFLFGNQLFISKNIALIFTIILLSFFSFQFLLSSKINHIIYVYEFQNLIPTIPFLIFISIELNFFLQKVYGTFIGYKVIFLLLFLLIVILTLILKKVVKFEIKIKNGLIISCLFAYVLLVYYQPISTFSNEMFELANPANSVLNVFKFKEIPFFDFLSSHMFSEQWFAYIYAFFFGFDGSLDFMSYSFLNEFIFLLLVQYFVNKFLKNNYLSLFVCFFFPFLYELFFPPVFFSILILFLLVKQLKNNNIISFYFLFFAIIVLIIWRIDTGYLAVSSILIFTPILYYCLNERFPFITFFKAISWSFLFVSLFFILLLCFVNIDEFIEKIKLSLHYFSANQAHGLSSISTQTHQFYLIHILFPFISVIISLAIIYELKVKLIKKSTENKLILISALYLFILFILNAQRGLVRHGFAEQNENYFVSTFYLALSLFIINYIKNSKNIATYFYAISFILFLTCKFFPYNPEMTKLENGLKNASILSFGTELDSNFKNRVKVETEFYSNNIKDITSFLNKNLNSDQTFMDFSNTPMLYFFTRRWVPGFFNQNLQNTVDDYMQISLIKELNTKDVPFVIFASDPINWFDQTDGIYNTIRYYLIAEHIFKHYKPYKKISNKSVWISKQHDFLNKNSNYDFSPYSFIDLKYLPYYSAEYLKSENSEIQTKIVRNLNTLTKKYIKIEKKDRNMKHMFLSINLKETFQKEQYSFKIYTQDFQDSLVFAFNLKKNYHQEYIIRLTNHKIWHQNKDLFLSLSDNEKIKEVLLLKDLRFED